MKRARWMLALPALMIATSGAALASEIRDKAGMFGADAVRKAQAELDRIEREYQVPVTIETVDSLNGKTINEALVEHAKAVRAKGIYTLIARQDKKIQIEPERSYRRFVTESRTIAVRDAFNKQFAKGDFDAGLIAGVSKLDATLAEARAEAGGSLKPATPPARRAAEAPVAARRPAAARTSNWGVGSLLGIVLMIFAALLVFRIIGGLFSAARGGGGYGGGMGGPGGRMGGPGYGGGGPGYGGGGPGYGAPGYGGGGGGFMSSLFGGIGGAMAGNWLYDRMSGGHHGGSHVDQTSYDPAQGAVPDQSAGPIWDQPADEGASWGSTGGDVGGGDWGGGGGGDWGGGGGGDWGGGGGGGDWGGGGGDEGGSW